MKYIPHTEMDIKEMLEEIGVNSIDQLFEDIPQDIQKESKLNLEPGVDDIEIEKELKELANKSNTDSYISFLGGGVYTHYIHPAVSYLIERGEFLTSYTPYQPELSQGTLQAIFEFQTVVSELFNMDIANASLYDGASATAEAALMSLRINEKREKIVISQGVHPEYIETVATYLRIPKNSIKELIIPVTEQGVTDLNLLEDRLKGGDIATFIVGYPNFFGIIEPLKLIREITKKYGTLLVTVTQEMLSLGVLEPPGSFDADIAVGEGQSLCNLPSLGGPGVGLFATKDEYKRQIPGRLVGETVDREGKRAFVLTLATREQHIRRAKATSNICTNQNLMALSFLIQLSLLGKRGFKKLAELCLKRSYYLREKLKSLKKFSLKFSGSHFNEFVISSPYRGGEEVIKFLKKEKILVGPDLGRWYPEFNDCFLVAINEFHSKKMIDYFLELLRNLE